LQELYRDYSGDSATRLIDPTWLSIFRIHRRMASTFRKGRALIAGDAAHLTSPLGGQGVNTGLNDAFNLGWKLALVIQGRADERLIDTYEAERRPSVERIDRATAAWTSVLFGDSVGARFVRRWIALPAMRWRTVQAWVLTRRGALQSSYRGGPLAQDAGNGVARPDLPSEAAARRRRPGCRMPTPRRFAIHDRWRRDRPELGAHDLWPHGRGGERLQRGSS
jgi:4,5-epoxidase